MSLSLLNSTILRQKIATGFVTKGSSIAWIEEDDNWTIVVDAIRELANVPVDTTGFEEYNAGTTYENGDFVAYNGNIYQYINNVPSAGVTPGTDVLYWEISSQGQFAHERNKDTYLDLGGTYEVSAQDIYNLLNAGPLSLEWGSIDGTITDQTDLVNYTIHQGTNTLTENLSFDLDGYLFSILNGDIDMNGNQINDVIIADTLGQRILEERKMYEPGGNLVADFQNQTLGGIQPSVGWANGTLRKAIGGNPTVLNWFDLLFYDEWGFDSGNITLIKNPGDPVETNGNWRTAIDGDDFVIQRRESGVWVTKFNQGA